MEKRINKEIREYKESIVWGLSMRQFLFSVLGIIISVGIYFLLRGKIGTEAVSWACIFGMLPCALLGFMRYNKMPAEKFLWTLIKSELLMKKNLSCKPYNLYYEIYRTFSDDENKRKTHIIASLKKKDRQKRKEKAQSKEKVEL